MKHTCLFILLILSQTLFAQIENLKQITDYDFDSRNPNYSNGYGFPFVTFEGHTDSSSMVFISLYNSWNDSFSEPILVSDSTGVNKNPVGMEFNSYSNDRKQIIVWEKENNGNIDLVYKEFSIESYDSYFFSDETYLTETTVNENNFSFVEDYLGYRTFEIVYEREGSIFLYTKTDSSAIEEVVFPSMDCGCSYKQPTGINNFYLHGLSQYYDKGQIFVAIEQNIATNLSKLIYRYRINRDSTWSDIMTLYDSTNCQKPKFFLSIWDGESPLTISFETIIDDKTKIMYYTSFDDFGNNSEANEYYSKDYLESNNFSSYLADTGISWGAPFISVPNSAKIVRNDSTFILVPVPWYGYETYEVLPVKYSNTSHKLGQLGYKSMSSVTYTIWEDSSANGRINLFGKGRYEIVVGVEDDNKSIPTEFTLSQNYPNPFNPSTTINYSIPLNINSESQVVTLKIYDILGRELATLIDKEQMQGNYTVKFDANQLTSGMYFYKLQYGSSVKTRKMMLLK